MDIREFQTKSKRTCPTLGSLNINLVHMALGINSEIVELEDAIGVKDYVNVGEEVADLLWYVGNYCTFRGYDIPYPKNPIDFKDSRSMIADLYYSTADLQDLVKKFLAYGKPINRTTEELFLTRNYRFSN
jgi:NTP pyrophosphatase (non-canonical NTP hydrolase)